MFTVSHEMPIKHVEAGLTQAQVWQGLVLKAENPVPFLEGMTACTVVERGENWLLRDFTLRGEKMQERVVFEPETRVIFTRTKSKAMGTVVNEIIKTENGAIALKFTFSLTVEGLKTGSQAETEYAERMSKSYFKGVTTTLKEIRRRVQSGKLDAG